MAKGSANTIADGIFAGLDPERAKEIAAHFESQMAEQRKSLDALLEEATAAATQPAEPQPTELTADNIIAALAQMRVAVGHCLVVLHDEARKALRSGDHIKASRYSRVATVFGEFSNAVAEFLAHQGP